MRAQSEDQHLGVPVVLVARILGFKKEPYFESRGEPLALLIGAQKGAHYRLCQLLKIGKPELLAGECEAARCGYAAIKLHESGRRFLS